jgi:hypothetical protein
VSHGYGFSTGAARIGAFKSRWLSGLRFAVLGLQRPRFLIASEAWASLGRMRLQALARRAPLSFGALVCAIALRAGFGRSRCLTAAITLPCGASEGGRALICRRFGTRITGATVLLHRLTATAAFTSAAPAATTPPTPPAATFGPTAIRSLSIRTPFRAGTLNSVADIVGHGRRLIGPRAFESAILLIAGIWIFATVLFETRPLLLAAGGLL